MIAQRQNPAYRFPPFLTKERFMKSKFVLFFLILICTISFGFSELISEQGEGHLEKQKGTLILHLKGTPYERGFQHGTLLKEQIARNIATYIDQPKSDIPGRVESFAQNISLLMSFVPEHFKEEMQGLADGSGVPLQKIVILNLFPEMFHCSGITVSGDASKKGVLYHARVLDYSVGKNLQSTAVLQIVQPDKGNVFLNVSYAGFIGSITGMNKEKIAIGEIGGLGYGNWSGVPMAFLLRDILQFSSSIDDIKTHLQDTPKTCEYYYVFSDGKTNESIGVYATASQVQFFTPGESYALMAPTGLPDKYGSNGDNDKFFLSDCTLENTAYQSLLFEKDNRLAMLFRVQPKDCLLLTGFTHPERYPTLVERVLKNYGHIDETALMDIIKCPVARPSNLHNAIFCPSALKVWIAHAGPTDEPACDQEYQEWDLLNLLTN